MNTQKDSEELLLKIWRVFKSLASDYYNSAQFVLVVCKSLTFSQARMEEY